MKVDGAAYCTLTVPAGATVSTAWTGMDCRRYGGSQGDAGGGGGGAAHPGADLTVLIRL